MSSLAIVCFPFPKPIDLAFCLLGLSQFCLLCCFHPKLLVFSLRNHFRNNKFRQQKIAFSSKSCFAKQYFSGICFNKLGYDKYRKNFLFKKEGKVAISSIVIYFMTSATVIKNKFETIINSKLRYWLLQYTKASEYKTLVLTILYFLWCFLIGGHGVPVCDGGHPGQWRHLSHHWRKG